jgi:hypothetical protein
VRLAVSSDFTEAEKTRLPEIETRWNRFTGRPTLSLVLDTSASLPDECIILQRPYPMYWHVNQADQQIANGQEWDDSGMIEISTRYFCLEDNSGTGLGCFESTVLHEIGHLFGMRHIQEIGIMHAPHGPDFTQADKEECRHAGACT